VHVNDLIEEPRKGDALPAQAERALPIRGAEKGKNPKSLLNRCFPCSLRLRPSLHHQGDALKSQRLARRVGKSSGR